MPEPTKLITAEEWVERIRQACLVKTHFVSRCDPPMVAFAAMVPEIQLNAERYWLERAACWTCLWCTERCPLSDVASLEGWHECPHGHEQCDAWWIRQELAKLETPAPEFPACGNDRWKMEDPAPTVEQRRGGIAIERGKTPSGNDVIYMTRETPAQAKETDG